MFRYQILVEYLGTSFVGWQMQKKGVSIQKVIQLVLSRLLKQKILLYGSGRTDAGVHAFEQSAHFDVKNKIQNIEKFIKSINFFLNPKKISVINIKKKKLNFKSRSFLKNQVRSMVGCLKLLGEKKWSIKKFEKVIKSKNRQDCAPPAPAHGLYLEKVTY